MEVNAGNQMEKRADRETQYATILQMGSQELREYLENLLQENPVLEMEDTYQQRAADPMKQKLEWLETADAQNKPYYEADEGETEDPVSNYGTVAEEDLSYYLRSQLRMLNLKPEILKAAQYVIENLDDNGYLEETNQAMAAFLDMEDDIVDQAVRTIQSLEPAGIGARTLQECLRLQLLRRDKRSRLAIQIVDGYLNALAEKNYGYIARHLDVKVDSVRRACSLIRKLNPRPGIGFSSRDNLPYINPDILVVNFPGHFEVLTNDYYFPVLRINKDYQKMLRETEETDVKEYLTGRLEQANWVIEGIEQRKAALLACVKGILEFQFSFFRQGPGYLSPLSLEDAAARAGLSIDIMELTIKDKYLQCSSGVYPLSYFFHR